MRGWPVMWDRLYVGMSEDRPAGWDFFVSYTQADRAWAEWIAWMLEEDGHQVLVQAWDFVPGSNWIQGMQAGVARGGADDRGAVAGLPGVGVRHGRVAGGVGQ